VKGIVALSTFPEETGLEKAYYIRRGFRSVVWYVFVETGNLVLPLPLMMLLVIFSFRKDKRAKMNGVCSYR
jgi:hypothetical protein